MYFGQGSLNFNSFPLSFEPMFDVFSYLYVWISASEVTLHRGIRETDKEA